jgi:hypothetical protein
MQRASQRPEERFSRVAGPLLEFPGHSRPIMEEET